jgi:uncharacterized membrane protein
LLPENIYTILKRSYGRTLMKSDTVKNTILYIFASTGAVLILLIIFALFNGEKPIIDGVVALEIMGANTVITIGLTLTNKIEFSHIILGFLLDIGFMIGVIVVSWKLFAWPIPVWIPVVIVIIVYILFYLLNAIRSRKDIEEINEILQKIKEKDADNAS